MRKNPNLVLGEETISVLYFWKGCPTFWIGTTAEFLRVQLRRLNLRERPEAGVPRPNPQCGEGHIDSLGPKEALRFNNLMQTFFWTQVLRLEGEALFSTPNAVLYKDVLAHPDARSWYISTRAVH